MSLFIVIEGLDCSGKTSITEIIRKKLKDVTVFRFPERESKIGQIINSFLKKDIKLGAYEAHLLYSANRYEFAEQIEESKKKGLVICDRYWMSGAVYSAAKGIDYDWAKSSDKYLPQPNLTFFLDVDVDETSKRSTFGREAHDKIEFQKKVYDIYIEKAKEENVIIVECKNKTPEDIAEFVLRKIEEEAESH